MKVPLPQEAVNIMMKDLLNAPPDRRYPFALLSTNELAALLRCDRGVIERLVKRGVLRPYRVGRTFRFDAQEVMDRLKVPAPENQK